MNIKNFKKPIIEWELEDVVHFNNEATILMDEVIESNYNQFLKSLKFKQAFETKNSLLEEREVKNTYKDLVEIIEYVENEIVVFSSKLFPINYFKLESYSKNIELKNDIIYSISDKLKDLNITPEGNEIIDTWDKALLFIQIKKEGHATDFDNYFCKPFVDGIKKAWFINDDNPKCLNINYSNLDSETQLIKLTLINAKYYDKYLEKIKKIMIL